MNQPSKILNGFEVGHFLLDADTGELYKDGKLCKRLRPQAHKVFLELVKRAGEVVTREELVSLLWSGSAGEPEGGLKKIIGWLRQDIGDSVEDPQYIEVIPRIGARLIAHVERLEADRRTLLGEYSFNRRALSSGRVAVYRVMDFYEWPYQSVESQGVYDLDAPIRLDTNLASGTKYRCVSTSPHQSIDWGLLGHNVKRGRRQSKNGTDVVCTQAELPSRMWIQIEYHLYRSFQRTDETQIAKFRDHLISKGCNHPSLRGNIQPTEAKIGSYHDPYFQWYEMGEGPKSRLTYVGVTSKSDIPYINAHTIPEGLDYELVQASVIDFKAYDRAPTYRELFAQFEFLHEWYITCGGGVGA